MNNITRYLKKLSVSISFTIIAIHSMAQAISTVKPAKDTVADCGCPAIKFINPGLRFYNDLGSRISYESLTKATKWRVKGDKKGFDMLFISNDQFGGEPGYFSDDITLVSPRDPIKIIHPDNTFTLNLSPCPNENNYRLFHLWIIYKHPIVADIRDFDISKFDHSTLAYTHLLFKFSKKRPDQMIRIAFQGLAARQDGLQQMNKSILAINQEFRAGIPLVNGKNYRDSTVILAIQDSLVSKKLRQENVFTTAFVLSAPGIHQLTYSEQDKLETLFQPYCQESAFAIFEKSYINPHMDISFDDGRAVVEISSKIMHSIKPALVKNQLFDEVWITFNSAAYTNEKGMQFRITKACLPPSVITNTSIGVDFSLAELLTDSVQLNEAINYMDYPQFKAQANNNGSKKVKAAKPDFDNLLKNFTGLFIKQADVKLPYGKETYRLKCAGLLINNKIITGNMIIRFAPEKSNTVLVDTEQGTTKAFNPTVLVSMLKKSGLNDVFTRVINNQLFIYFKKIAV